MNHEIESLLLEVAPERRAEARRLLERLPRRLSASNITPQVDADLRRLDALLGLKDYSGCTEPAWTAKLALPGGLEGDSIAGFGALAPAPHLVLH